MIFNNNICAFEPLFDNFDFTKKYDVISTSFFKMDKHYKNFNIYVNGLKNWANRLRNLNSAYKMIIFIDQHIYEDKYIMDIINSNKKYFLPILFKCSEFMTNTYHNDAFGTFVRFFPLFNFANNFTNNVFVVDIDLGHENFKRFNYILKFNKPITVSAAITDFFRTNEVYIYAGNMFFNNTKYDKNIIIDFIKNAHNLSDTGYYKKRLTTFGYGTDETFINQFIKKNISHINCQINYNPNWFIFNNIDIIKTNKFSFKIFKYLMGNKYNGETLDQMIIYVDDIFYKSNKNVQHSIEISAKIYKLIKYMIKNKIEWIRLNEMKIMYKYFKNIVSASAFFKINLNTNKLISVELYEPIYIKNTSY